MGYIAKTVSTPSVPHYLTHYLPISTPLFTAGLCSFTALLALLTHQYPEPMGYRKFPNKGAVRQDREEVRPFLKSRDQELSNGI